MPCAVSLVEREGVARTEVAEETFHAQVAAPHAFIINTWKNVLGPQGLDKRAKFFVGRVPRIEVDLSY